VHEDMVERLARLEAHVSAARECVQIVHEQRQTDLLRSAEALERISSHIENSKRMYGRIEVIETALGELASDARETRAQLRQIESFHGDVKRAFWMVITGGAIVLWWGVQKWIEHGR